MRITGLQPICRFEIRIMGLQTPTLQGPPYGKNCQFRDEARCSLSVKLKNWFPGSNIGLVSDRENYFWCVGQNVRQAFSAQPDILSPCQTLSPVDDWQISMVILVVLIRHFMCIEPCQTKCPARSELSAGHQQKSAGHVRHISRSLTVSNHIVIILN